MGPDIIKAIANQADISCADDNEKQQMIKLLKSVGAKHKNTSSEGLYIRLYREGIFNVEKTSSNSKKIPILYAKYFLTPNPLP